MLGLAVRLPECEEDQEEKSDDERSNNMGIAGRVDVGPDDAHQDRDGAHGEQYDSCQTS